MNTPSPARPDELVEAYLDRLAADEAAPAAAGADPAMARQVELQARIDGRLGEMLQFQAPSQEQLVASLLARPSQQAAPARRWRRTMLWQSAAAVAAAAAIGWIVFTATVQPRRLAPLFEAAPLADVYRDAVANGFEPYYECREADRFADTFARRQGTPLKLLPLPPGSVMLGLSYPGGLSRETTAMLCRVDDKPVMVFVDRLEADRPGAAANTGDVLHVFRAERAGLVFYEVTPLAAPRMMHYLAPLGVEAEAPQG
ncbi:MAG: hypothetical protein DCC67_07935 [Planctomycetota bacterium]|nr:MAG: hypothetical protein DCC67_07935 [Planctomycetota bacterium]